MCVNCNAAVAAMYCGHCGQKAGPAQLSLRLILSDYLREVLNLERGLPLTLWMLLAKPGALTAEYLSGRRVRYSTPLKLYMLASVAMFALFVLTRPLDKAFYGYHGHADWEVLSNALAYGFLLSVPVFALTLKLLYLRARRPLVDHLVFTLHAGTAALLFGCGFLLLDVLAKLVWGSISQAPIDPQVISYAIPVLLAGYLFQSLRTVYPGSRSRTTAKWLALLLLLLVVTLGVALGAVKATARFGTPVNYVAPELLEQASQVATPN